MRRKKPTNPKKKKRCNLQRGPNSEGFSKVASAHSPRGGTVGRPKLPDEMRKMNFTIGVTPELRDAIQVLAEDSDMSASAWACAALTKVVSRDMIFAKTTAEENVVTAVEDTRRVLRLLLAMRNGSA